MSVDSKAGFVSDQPKENAIMSKGNRMAGASHIRLPLTFYVDHMERALPTPEDVSNAKSV